MKTINRIQLRECRWWTVFAVATVWLVGGVSTPVAFAQFGHSDIDFGLDGNKLITDKRVYDSYFPTFGISKHFSANPGFAAESDGIGTVGPGREVVYDVLGALYFWDGTQFEAPHDEVRIRIDNNPRGSHSTVVGAVNSEQPGSSDPPANRIGASSAAGEVHSHVNFFLESGDEDPPVGAYGLKIAISTDSEQIIDSDPVFVVFNYGLEELQFDESLVLYEGLLDSTGILGDLNQDGALDVGDIDMLTAAVLRNETSSEFDLNADNQVNQEDRQEWVKVLRVTYFGDSDLDGDFDSSDLIVVFAAGKYESGDPAMWRDGDWDGNGLFETSDLVMALKDGGYEQPSNAHAAVPEPNAILIFGFGAIALLGARMRNGRHQIEEGH